MVIRHFQGAVSSRRIFLLAFVSLLILSAYRFKFLWQQPFSEEVNLYAQPARPLILGVADKVYVLSLAKRDERRKQMETLRRGMGLNWVYVDALDLSSPLVNTLLHWVAKVRQGPPVIINQAWGEDEKSSYSETIPFEWPADIDAKARSFEPLTLWEEGTWSAPTPSSEPPLYPPLVCAVDDYTIRNYSMWLDPFLYLTPARVACWHSHLSVIHKHANSIPSDNAGVAIIFEDDIDMELDTQEQLVELWPSLPKDWDMVFLGYCWSNETFRPAVDARDQVPLDLDHDQPSFKYRLHHSNGPKCTHAYALSRVGARRLLLHLTYPPFAYSRAVDQAIAWLIQSGRLNSFTVVPSLVIQRKVTPSDIEEGHGNVWRDTLRHGFFEDKSSSETEATSG